MLLEGLAWIKVVQENQEQYLKIYKIVKKNRTRIKIGKILKFFALSNGRKLKVVENQISRRRRFIPSG